MESVRALPIGALQGQQLPGVIGVDGLDDDGLGEGVGLPRMDAHGLLLLLPGSRRMGVPEPRRAAQRSLRRRSR